MLNACVAGCGACGGSMSSVCAPAARAAVVLSAGVDNGAQGCGATRAGVVSKACGGGGRVLLMRAPRMPPVCGRAALGARCARYVWRGSRRSCRPAPSCVLAAGPGSVYRAQARAHTGHGGGSTTTRSRKLAWRGVIRTNTYFRGCVHTEITQTTQLHARRCAQRHTRRCSFSLALYTLRPASPPCPYHYNINSRAKRARNGELRQGCRTGTHVACTFGSPTHRCFYGRI